MTEGYQPVSDDTRSFKIRYSSMSTSEEEKIWFQGFLIISSEWLWLKDDKKVTIRKGKVGKDMVESLSTTDTVTSCGRYIIHNQMEIFNINSTSVNSADINTKYQNKENLLMNRSQVNDVTQNKKIKMEESDLTQKSLFTIDDTVKSLLKPHQIVAAEFLINRLRGRDPTQTLPEATNDISNLEQQTSSGPLVTGAILADEMGTGKTLTALSVLWTFCKYGRCKGVVVCPASLVGNWEREINRWFPSTLSRSAIIIHGGKSQGLKGSDALVQRFVCSHPSIHPMLVTSYEMFRELLNTLSTLDVLICDEGHRLKNAYGTKTTIAIGNCTPLQNNLEELYAVVQLTAPGYLGTLKEFQESYADVITAGRDRNATEDMRNKGEQAASELRESLSKILIRRTAESILGGILPPRQVFEISIALSDVQQSAYSHVADELKNAETLHHRSSSKIVLLMKLLEVIRATGERVVVASLFTDTLDVIQSLTKAKGWLALRLDGGVAPDKRQAIVQHFNREGSPFFVMLLSTRAGGVGLNLIGASRLVLFEPDWNPATDAQAMGRVWRQGQTRPVTIYRLITSNTVEESMLSRQKDKSGLEAILMKMNKSHGDGDDGDSPSRDESSSELAPIASLSLMGLKSLIYPSASTTTTTTTTSASSDDTARSIVGTVGFAGVKRLTVEEDECLKTALLALPHLVCYKIDLESNL
eukprot:gene8816-18247_t